jgi:hypothetical protein
MGKKRGLLFSRPLFYLSWKFTSSAEDCSGGFAEEHSCWPEEAFASLERWPRVCLEPREQLAVTLPRQWLLLSYSA